MQRLLSLVLLTALLPACALHLRAPEADPVDDRPVQPAGEVSYIAAVAQLPFATLAALADQALLSPVKRGGRVAFAEWSVAVGKSGPVAVRAENGLLCFKAPFRGQGTLLAVTRLERAVEAAVEVCALPRLDANGSVKLQDPVVRVALGGLEVGGSTQVLYNALAEQLQHVTGEQLADHLSRLAVPAGDLVEPLAGALTKPMALSGGACLRLRPDSMRLAQPVVTSSGLRLAASIAARPTLERPCSAQVATTGRLPRTVVDDLSHPQTVLVLPVAVSLASVHDDLLRALQAKGPIRMNNGELAIRGLRLDSAQGRLLARVAVQGEVRDSFLLIPFKRQIDGEVAVWGVPDVTERDIGLRDVQLDVATADTVAGLAAAWQRERLTEVVAGKARVPRTDIEAEARKAIEGFASGQRLAGQPLRIRVDTRELAIQQVRAAGQRLELLVRFAGYIVLGDPGRP
jgi:hypothetical protein